RRSLPAGPATHRRPRSRERCYCSHSSWGVTTARDSERSRTVRPQTPEHTTTCKKISCYFSRNLVNTDDIDLADELPRDLLGRKLQPVGLGNIRGVPGSRELFRSNRGDGVRKAA